MLRTAATIGVVIGLAVIVRRADGLRRVDPALRVPVVALLLFGSAPVSSNLRFGQISVVLVALVLVDCLGILPTRYRGALTGIAAAIKLTPMIFVVYWWVSGQRRTAINAVAAFGACTGIAWLVLPGESVRFWFTEIWNVDRVGNIATGGNQSLNGALLRLELPDTWRTALAGTIGVAVGGRRGTIAWFALVAAVMVLPVTSLGAALPTTALTGNARLLLAVAVACLVPFAALRRKRADQEPAARPSAGALSMDAGPV
ncbi:glycosyltransferase family 87 protein [Micromonospora sp. NPDC048830]|uniref:glycosyltransferase family 87 protein n=1 Tax=Micromonospora sp. NPDC048830 TaxID=3364257 RepID=UPI0037194263